MNKTIRNLTLLSTIFTLTSCGGIKWEETTRAILLEKLEAAGEKCAEEYKNLKAHYSYRMDYHEKKDTIGEWSENYKYDYDIDCQGLRLKIVADISNSYYEAEFSSTGEPEERADKYVEYYVYMNDIGLVNFNETSNYYRVFWSNEEIESALRPSETKVDFILGRFKAIIDDDIYISITGSDMWEVVSDETDVTEYDIKKYSEKFLLSGDKSFKYEFDMSGRFDDYYKVDFDWKTKMEINNYKLIEYSDYSKEDGLYYVSDTESVDYKYLYDCSFKASEFIDFKIPSIADYHLPE